MENSNNYKKYFVLTFTWTWFFLSIPIIFSMPLDNLLTLILYIIAGIGPMLSAIFLAYTNESKEYFRNFFKRIINFKLISYKWYLFIILFVPINTFIAILINYLFTKDLMLDSFITNISNPLHLIPLMVFLFFFGPLPEEIGWRGYALDNLLKRHGFITSSLMLGLIWGMWHLPMFFIVGTYQNDLLNESVFLAFDFLIAIISSSVIYSLVYYKNNNSILSAILFHFCVNFFGELFSLPANVMYIRTAVLVLFLVLLLIVIKYHKRLY